VIVTGNKLSKPDAHTTPIDSRSLPSLDIVCGCVNLRSLTDKADDVIELRHDRQLTLSVLLTRGMTQIASRSVGYVQTVTELLIALAQGSQLTTIYRRITVELLLLLSPGPSSDFHSVHDNV
jgi:hypothetical protein